MEEDEIENMAWVNSGKKPSHALISRIKISYQQALTTSPSPSDSVLWSMIRSKQEDIHNSLMTGNDEEIFDILSDPQSTNLYYGVDNLAKDILVRINGDNWKQHYTGLKSELDDLLVALGVVNLFNPQGGSRYPNKDQPIAKSVDDAMQAVDNLFHGKLSFPNPFAGEFGISTSKGVMSYRSVQAIYQAVLARRHAVTSCLEIGGGMGRTAYYSHLLGLNYSVVDLPMTIVGQALFLSAALGEDSIWMIGDTMPRENRIVLLPPSELKTAGRVDVVLNVDSLTEMGERSAKDYLVWIGENSNTFLSINHEANDFTASGLCQALYPSSLRSRSPYWLRPGYVEEAFSFDQPHRVASYPYV